MRWFSIPSALTLSRAAAANPYSGRAPVHGGGRGTEEEAVVHAPRRPGRRRSRSRCLRRPHPQRAKIRRLQAWLLFMKRSGGKRRVATVADGSLLREPTTRMSREGPRRLSSASGKISLHSLHRPQVAGVCSNCLCKGLRAKTARGRIMPTTQLGSFIGKNTTVIVFMYIGGARFSDKDSKDWIILTSPSMAYVWLCAILTVQHMIGLAPELSGVWPDKGSGKSRRQLGHHHAMTKLLMPTGYSVKTGKVNQCNIRSTQ